jgi:DnaK suppressor protein
MAERARLTVELARRRLDSPPRENVIVRDEQPPIAHEAYLAGQFDRIEADLLNQIDEAVACIDGGTYGICIECEKRIEERRLEAVPSARRCFVCEVVQNCRQLEAA